MAALAHSPEKLRREYGRTRYWARIARNKFGRFDGKGKDIK